MTECPVYTNFTADTEVLTGDNIASLVPDNFARTVNTVVNVRCNANYQLNGQSTFTCLSTGQWSFSTVPTCEAPTRSTTPAPALPLDNETKILIGVVCGLAAIIVIVLVAMIIAVRVRDRRRQKRDKEMRKTIVMNDRPGRRYRNRGYEDSQSVENSVPPPPYRYNDWRAPSGSRSVDYDRHSQRSGPMYLPSSKAGYENHYDQLKRSRKTQRNMDEEFNAKGKKPYVHDWIRRSSSEAGDYSHPSVHGRSGYGDSGYWRQAY